MRLIVLGRYHYPRSIFIQAMDNPRPYGAVDPGKIPAVRQKSVYERPSGVSGGGMNHHTAGFIENDDIMIFV